MKLADFQGIHRNRTITVLGKGPSRDVYEEDGTITMGVNHHWRWPVYCDYAVYMDHEMDKHIRDHCPPELSAGLYIGSTVARNPYPKVKGEIEPAGPRNPKVSMDLSKPIPMWGYTMFYALGVAAGMSPSNIEVYGLDLNEDVRAYRKQKKYLEQFWPMFLDMYPGKVRVHTLHYESDKVEVVKHG